MTLAGQVQKRKEPRARVAHLPVLLMSGKDLLASAISNEFGEFVAYPQRSQVRLHVPIRPTGDGLEVGLADDTGDDAAEEDL